MLENAQQEIVLERMSNLVIKWLEPVAEVSINTYSSHSASSQIELTD